MTKKTLTILILTIPATLLFVLSFGLSNDSNTPFTVSSAGDGEYAYAQSGVPEPAVMGLLAVGGAGLLIRRLRTAACRRETRRRRPAMTNDPRDDGYER